MEDGKERRKTRAGIIMSRDSPGEVQGMKAKGREGTSTWRGQSSKFGFSQPPLVPSRNRILVCVCKDFLFI